MAPHSRLAYPLSEGLNYRQHLAMRISPCARHLHSDRDLRLLPNRVDAQLYPSRLSRVPEWNVTRRPECSLPPNVGFWRSLRPLTDHVDHAPEPESPGHAAEPSFYRSQTCIVKPRHRLNNATFTERSRHQPINGSDDGLQMLDKYLSTQIALSFNACSHSTHALTPFCFANQQATEV